MISTSGPLHLQSMTLHVFQLSAKRLTRTFSSYSCTLVVSFGPSECRRLPSALHACQVALVVSDSVTLWTVALQVPLSMGFSRQRYWSGLPCPPCPPWDFPHPGLEPVSPGPSALAGRFFITEPPAKSPFCFIETFFFNCLYS